MASRATETGFEQFQRLMSAALLAGALAGTVLFVYQYFVMVPRIQAAEAYEARQNEAAEPLHEHKSSEWKPADGLERTFLTAASTILAGVGFAAIFFSVMALGGADLTGFRGLVWGLAAFACIVVAPALGLPPEPPGVPVADVRFRQLWWTGTVVATAFGFFLIFGRGRAMPLRLLGFACLAIPHIIGAPTATGPEIVPSWLVREFAVASIIGNAIFWLTLGMLGGFFLKSSTQHPSHSK